MTHTVFPLFSTPLYKSNIGPLPAKDVGHIINSKFKRTTSNDGNISLDTRILNAPELANLRSSIMDHVNTYLYDELKVNKNIKFKLLNSWIMQHTPGDFGAPHSHVNSLFSGVVYIKTSENCGDIKFNHKQPDLISPTISLDYDEFNIFNSSSWYFVPVDGLIVIFPSHATHEITSNLSNDSRYCIAFNIFVEGDLGDPDGIAVLSVK
jgi:uncharacterized protein (TIGR02466 family)